MRTVTFVGLGAVLVVALGCAAAPRNDGSGPAPVGPGASRVAASPGAASSGRPTAPTAEPPVAAAPTDKVYQGRGDKIVKINLAEDLLHIAAITHTGRGNFIIRTLDSSGDTIDLLVNEIGNYTGVRPLDFDDEPVALEIKAEGNWKVTIKAATKAPLWAGSSSGNGDAVLLVSSAISDEGFVTVKVTHKGSSNFVVRSYGDDRGLLINEIGSYRGEVLLPAGTLVLEIVADGTWTVTKS